MAELGSGNGSDYPGTLDTDNILEVNTSVTGKTKARAEVPNDLAAAVVAIETELGTNPAGDLTDVKTFLQTEHNTDGVHQYNTVSKSANYTATATDNVIVCSGSAFTVTLPTAVGIQGKDYTIIRNTNVVITIVTNGSETLSGADSLTLNSIYSYIRVISDNSNWIIISIQGLVFD